MKQILLLLILCCGTAPATAQWYFIDGGLGSGYDLVALGVHDAHLYASGTSSVVRYISPQNWAGASAGIDFTQGSVTSFASLGRYFFAGMTNSIGGPGTAWRSSDAGVNWAANAGGYVCSNGIDLFCVSDGIYRSLDSGNTGTWQKMTTFRASYLATHDAYIFASTTSGVWRSTNNGTNWSPDTIPLPNLNNIAFLGALTFGANGSIIKSTDSGSHWTDVSIPGRNTSLLASDSTWLFAGTDSGVYVSLDSGGHWRNVSEGLAAHASPPYGPTVTAMCVFDTLLVVGINANNNYGYTSARPIREMVDTTQSMVVETQQQGDTIVVYPNPSTGMVTIRSGGEAILGVRVLNVLGETVTGTEFREPGPGNAALDLSKLPAGTYFLEIETPKGTVLRKVARE